MSVITISHKGNFLKTFRFLRKIKSKQFLKKLDGYGKLGVEALSQATPRDTGKTSDSWIYEIEHGGNSVSIIWKNTNNNHGVYVAVLIQYGHGTGTGGYVQGIDYINPAMRPVFDKIANEVWLEVISDE